MAKGKLTMPKFDAYFEALAAAGRDVDAAADRAVQAGADVALDGMQERAPVDTHNLESKLSIGTGVAGNTHYAEIGLLSSVDDDTARYGNAQEFGTSTMAAQPYVRPTMDEDAAKIRAAMRDSLKKDGAI